MASVVTRIELRPSPTAQPKFRALLVGVDHYSRSDSHWNDLHGTSDVRKVETLLKMYWGKTQPIEIKTLEDTAATKKAIKDDFENWLIKEANPDDRIFFYFSGHGTLVPAPDLATHVRSAILPYNAKKKGKGLDPESLITGLYFRDQLRALKQKGISNVTLMFDACNSAALSRGGDALSKAVENPNVDKSVPTAPERRGLSTDIDLSDFMVISAARADKSAFETDQGGNLTVAFAQAVHTYFGHQFTAKVTHDMTYADVRDGVMAGLATLPQPSMQEPSFNGRLDRVVFGVGAVAPEPYYRVTATDHVSIAAGELFGIGQNMGFAIYPAGTATFEGIKPIAHGTVIGTPSAYSCTVRLDGYPGDIKALNGTRARLVDPTPDACLAVDTSALDPSSAEKSPVERLRAFQSVSILALKSPLFRKATKGETYDAKVLPPGAKVEGFRSLPMAWVVADPAGNHLAEVNSASTDSEIATQIQESLRLVARRKAILGVKAVNPDVRVEMEVVPVKVSNKIVTSLKPGTPIDPAPLVWKDKESFAVRVRATKGDGKAVADQSVYVVILDCLPDAYVGALWPSTATATESTRLIADGQWKYLGRFDSLVDEKDLSNIEAWHLDAKHGQGQEVFKLFASAESGIEYTPLLSPHRGEAGRGAESPLGRLLGAYRDGQPVNRAGTDSPEVSSYSIAQLTLTYVPKDK